MYQLYELKRCSTLHMSKYGAVKILTPTERVSWDHDTNQITVEKRDDAGEWSVSEQYVGK